MLCNSKCQWTAFSINPHNLNESNNIYQQICQWRSFICSSSCRYLFDVVLKWPFRASHVLIFLSVRNVFLFPFVLSAHTPFRSQTYFNWLFFYRTFHILLLGYIYNQIFFQYRTRHLQQKTLMNRSVSKCIRHRVLIVRSPQSSRTFWACHYKSELCP